MNDIINGTLTPEEIAALMAQVHGDGEGEAAPAETTVFVTEDTADHVTVH